MYSLWSNERYLINLAGKVKLRCCYPRTQSKTVLLYTFILSTKTITLSTHISIRCFQYPRSSSPRIGTTSWHCDVNITLHIEPMKMRPSVNSSIAGNRSMNCWPVYISVLHLIGMLLLTAKMCIYCFCLHLYRRKSDCEHI